MEGPQIPWTLALGFCILREQTFLEGGKGVSHSFSHQSSTEAPMRGVYDPHLPKGKPGRREVGSRAHDCPARLESRMSDSQGWAPTQALAFHGHPNPYYQPLLTPGPSVPQPSGPQACLDPRRRSHPPSSPSSASTWVLPSHSTSEASPPPCSQQLTAQWP